MEVKSNSTCCHICGNPLTKDQIENGELFCKDCLYMLLFMGNN